MIYTESESPPAPDSAQLSRQLAGQVGTVCQLAGTTASGAVVLRVLAVVAGSVLHKRAPPAPGHDLDDSGPGDGGRGLPEDGTESRRVGL